MNIKISMCKHIYIYIHMGRTVDEALRALACAPVTLRIDAPAHGL